MAVDRPQCRTFHRSSGRHGPSRHTVAKTRPTSPSRHLPSTATAVVLANVAAINWTPKGSEALAVLGAVYTVAVIADLGQRVSPVSVLTAVLGAVWVPAFIVADQPRTSLAVLTAAVWLAHAVLLAICWGDRRELSQASSQQPKSGR